MSSSDDPSMRYGLIGEDNSSTPEKLAKYSGRVEWEHLRPHSGNGTLYFVDPAIPLADVGQALADDDTTTVRGWLQTGDLLQVSEPHARHWDASGDVFEALVVSPFVLCRPIPR